MIVNMEQNRSCSRGDKCRYAHITPKLPDHTNNNAAAANKDNNSNNIAKLNDINKNNNE